MASRYKEARIFEKLEFLEYLLETDPDKVKKPSGWLRRAIEEDYGKPDGFMSKAEREAAQAAENQRLRDQQRLEEEQQRQQAALLQQQEDKRQRKVEALRQQYGTSERELELWPQVLNSLKNQMTEATFGSHLANSLLLAIREGTVLIGVANPMAKAWVENRLASTIERTLASYLDGQRVALEVVTLDED